MGTPAPNQTSQTNVPPVLPVQPSVKPTPPPSQNSSKKNLLIFASLLALITIIGLTLFLFIQNKQNPSAPQSASPKALDKPDCSFSFVSLDEANKSIGKVCILNLSNQNLNNLPADMNKFINLKSISIAGNNFTQLPPVLLSIKTLESLDIDRTKIISLPADIKNLDNLQYLYADSLTSIPKELKLLTKLKRLYIKKTLVPESEVTDLRNSNPDIEIIFAKKITTTTTPIPEKNK